MHVASKHTDIAAISLATFVLVWQGWLWFATQRQISVVLDAESIVVPMPSGDIDRERLVAKLLHEWDEPASAPSGAARWVAETAETYGRRQSEWLATRESAEAEINPTGPAVTREFDRQSAARWQTHWQNEQTRAATWLETRSRQRETMIRSALDSAIKRASGRPASSPAFWMLALTASIASGWIAFHVGGRSATAGDGSGEMSLGLPESLRGTASVSIEIALPANWGRWTPPRGVRLRRVAAACWVVAAMVVTAGRSRLLDWM